MSEKQGFFFKYGILTAKKHKAILWDRLSVDFICTYKMIREGHYNPLILKPLIITCDWGNEFQGHTFENNQTET